MPFIYMPFTQLSEPAAEQIHEFLGPVIVYQPGGLPVPTGLSTLEEKGRIQIKIPLNVEDQDVLRSLKEQYHAWAEIQSDGHRIDTGAFMAANDSVPFFKEDSTAQIRAEMNRLRNGVSSKPEQNAVLTARLLLALAQEHDIQKMELTADLDAVSRMESHLMAELKGGDGDGLILPSGPMPKVEDMGGHMTRKRIESWSTLFLIDHDPPDIFVTDSQAVVQELCERSSELIAVLDDNQVKTAPNGLGEATEHFESLNDIFSELASSSHPLALLEKLSLKPHLRDQLRSRDSHWTLYMAAGVTPQNFWKCYAAQNSLQEKHKEKRPQTLNTLLFYLEI